MKIRPMCTMLCMLVLPLLAYGQQCTQKIYFWSPQTTNSVANIWRMDTTGANRQFLFNDAYHRRTLTVSDDGTMLAYTKRKNPNSGTGGDSLWICTSDIDGQNEVQHYLLPSYSSTEIRDLDFNSIHTKILFNTFEGNNRDGDLYVLDLIAHSVTQLTFNTDSCKGEAQYSSDDSKIVYTQLGTTWYAYPFPGRKMNSNGTGITAFNPAGYGNYHQFNYSPDGRKFVFSFFPALNVPYKLYMCDTSGANLKYLGYQTFYEMQPVFNPTGNKIAFIDNTVLRLMDTSGNILQVINPAANTSFNNVNWVRIPMPVVTVTPATPAICTGQSILLGATGANTYSWSPSAGLSSTTTATVTANPPGTTNYTVTGTNSFGCAGTAAVTLTVYTLPVITSGGNKAICPGGSTTLQGGGGVSYTWLPATGLSCTACTNPTATPLAATTYTVTGTDAHGCSNTAQATVSINTLPAITSGGNKSMCAGSSAQLQGGGGTSYAWSPSAGLSCTGCANPVANPSATTVYTVTGTDANGCSSTAQATVTVNALPVINASPTSSNICAGGSTGLTASGGSTYAWSPATGLSGTTGNAVTASPASTTTYTVTGTNSNNCSNTATATVTVIAKPNPPVVSTPVKYCLNATAAPLSATGSNLLWYTAASGGVGSSVAPVPVTAMVNNVSYYVSQTVNGCESDRAQIVVTTSPLPTVNISPSPVAICQGGSANITAGGAVSYAWSPGTGLSGTTTAGVTASPAATTTYTVTGTDGNSCSNTAQVTVTVNTIPPLPAVVTPVVYCRNDVAAPLTAGGASLNWYIVPSGGVVLPAAPVPYTVMAGTTTYYVSQVVNGCESGRAAIDVKVHALPVITATPSSASICEGTDVLIKLSGADNYSWVPLTGLQTVTANSARVAPMVTTTYTAYGTDANNCRDSVDIVVDVNPVKNTALHERVCIGGSYTFFDKVLQAAGTYKKTFKTYLGCDSVITLELVLDTPTHGKFNLPDDACAHTATEIVPYNMPANATYYWQITGSHIATGNGILPYTISWSDTGKQMVILVTQTPACAPYTFSDSIYIHQPYAHILVDNIEHLCLGDTIRLGTDATDSLHMLWLPPDRVTAGNLPEVKAVVHNGIYKVVATDKWGCLVSDSISLHGDPCCTVALPSAFTPNNDGKNDVFRVISEGHHVIEKFVVANRFGMIVFETNDQHTGWDGRLNGEPQDMGTYFYFLQYKCNGGAVMEQKGGVVLVR